MTRILSDIQDHILTIRINRPERKNALTGEMYDIITGLLESADINDSVRVIILAGTADVFTAGNDLQDFLDGLESATDNPPMRFIRQLSQTAKPVVASVSGAAIGIGTTLLMHCDLVVASDDSRFQLPFVNLGLCPEAASSLLFPQSAGFHLASEIFLTGRPFGTETAWRCGFINKIVGRDQVMQEARNFAVKIASFPPASVLLTKRLLKAPLMQRISEVMDKEAAHFQERLQTPEAKEAFTAFLEKRSPDFSKL